MSPQPEDEMALPQIALTHFFSCAESSEVRSPQSRPPERFGEKKREERLHFHLYPTTSARLILIIPDDVFIHRSVCLLASGPFVRLLSILVVQRILFVWK